MRPLILVTAFFLPSLAFCQTVADVDKAKAKLEALQKDRGFPGATVGFVFPDGKTATFSVGVAEQGKDKKLEPQMRMLAGSIGKTFVSAAFLQIATEKGVGIDDKVSKYLGDRPWFSQLPNAADLTIRCLMNHTSGIPEHVETQGFVDLLMKDPAHVWGHEELLKTTLGKAPLAKAGESFSYADTNYIVLGLILEKVSGKQMYELAINRFLKPLKLDRTMPSDKMEIPELAIGTNTFGPFPVRGPMLRDGKFVFNPQMEWCGGGFASTALDLAKWSAALYGGKVLTDSQFKDLTTGVSAGRLGGEYGLGVQIRPTPFGKSYGHGGWFPGWLSEMEYFPDSKIAIAIQFNTDSIRQLGKSTHGYLLDLMAAMKGS